MYVINSPEYLTKDFNKFYTKFVNYILNYNDFFEYTIYNDENQTFYSYIYIYIYIYIIKMIINKSLPSR